MKNIFDSRVFNVKGALKEVRRHGGKILYLGIGDEQSTRNGFDSMGDGYKILNCSADQIRFLRKRFQIAGPPLNYKRMSFNLFITLVRSMSTSVEVVKLD